MAFSKVNFPLPLTVLTCTFIITLTFLRYVINTLHYHTLNMDMIFLLSETIQLCRIRRQEVQ
jgi:hypothetical protein